MAGESRLRSFPLLRNAPLARLSSCLALAAAVPTLGTLATVAVAAIPIALAVHLAPSMIGVAAVLYVLLWLAGAFGVAWGSLALAKRAVHLRLKSGTLLLGEDGLTVRRYFSTRFFAWSRVREISVDDAGRALVVELDGGAREALLVPNPGELSSIARKLSEQHATARKSKRLRVLACDRPPDRAWLERVRVAAEEQTYRGEVVTEELLLEVAEDMTQLPEQRLGAAVALAKASPEIVKRVRIAAEATANPELAEALDRALEQRLDLKQARRAVKS